MFSVWINDGQTEMPPDDILYIISKEGIFLKKKMGMFESMAKVDGIGILNEMDAYASMDIKKIPAKLFAEVQRFFTAVYNQHHGEANVIIHYNQKRKTYRIEVPKQEVSAAGTEYESEVSYKDFVRLGTIHSHCNFSAFHSGTDQNDEATWDGLHITIGDNLKPRFSVAASIVANGTRFPVNPTDYVEGLELDSYEQQLGEVHINQLQAQGKAIPKPKEVLGYKITSNTSGFPSKWMDGITKKVYEGVVVHGSGVPVRGSRRWGRHYGHWGQRFHQRDTQQPGLFDGVGNSFYPPDPSMMIPEPGKGDSYTDILYRQFGNDDEWNPCEQCPYKDYKVDMLMEEVIDALDLDDDQLESLGYEFVEEDGASVDVAGDLTVTGEESIHNYVPEHLDQEGFGEGRHG